MVTGVNEEKGSGMGTCKECRAWEDGECVLVDWIATTETEDGANFSVYATSDDDQGLQCGLKTGPDFGCVQFQLRTKSEGR